MPGSMMRVPDSLSCYPNELQVSKSEVQWIFNIHKSQVFNIEQIQLSDDYSFCTRQDQTSVT